MCFSSVECLFAYSVQGCVRCTCRGMCNGLLVEGKNTTTISVERTLVIGNRNIHAYIHAQFPHESCVFMRGYFY